MHHQLSIAAAFCLLCISSNLSRCINGCPGGGLVQKRRGLFLINNDVRRELDRYFQSNEEHHQQHVFRDLMYSRLAETGLLTTEEIPGGTYSVMQTVENGVVSINPKNKDGQELHFAHYLTAVDYAAEYEAELAED